MTLTPNDFRLMRSGSTQLLLENDSLNVMAGIEQLGSGKESALLMLHGFSSTPAVFRQLIPHINGYDAILAPVLPGHAENISAFADIKAQEWLSAVQRHCENLLENYAKVDVLGLSLGGLLACYLGQHYPLNHLYLLAPALDLRLPLIPGLLLLNSLHALGFSAVYNTGANIMKPEQRDIAYRMIPVRVMREIFRLIRNFQFTAIKNCPIDLFLGKHDEVVAVERVASRFANNPETNIHWLNHSAHLLPLDTDFLDIAACINQNTTVVALDKIP